jgi:hypothetical protein
LNEPAVNEFAASSYLAYRHSWWSPLISRPGLFLFLVACSTVHAQDWPVYAGDPGGMKYSKLRQIDRSNVQQLKPAWIFHTTDISDGTK